MRIGFYSVGKTQIYPRTVSPIKVSGLSHYRVVSHLVDVKYDASQRLMSICIGMKSVAELTKKPINRTRGRKQRNWKVWRRKELKQQRERKELPCYPESLWFLGSKVFSILQPVFMCSTRNTFECPATVYELFHHRFHHGRNGIAHHWSWVTLRQFLIHTNPLPRLFSSLGHDTDDKIRQMALIPRDTDKKPFPNSGSICLEKSVLIHNKTASCRR